ncbi:MAG: hypothetical protein ACTHKS_01970 [Gaiellaceae bacterium]
MGQYTSARGATTIRLLMGMGNGQNTNASGRDHQRADESINCAECGISSGLYWYGWRAVRTDDPELDESPSLAFYCPACAMVEFGLPSRRPLVDRRLRPR